MAQYFLGQCKLGKQGFGAGKQLGLLPWQVSCGVFSFGADCSWACSSGTGHTLWHFLLVTGCGGCWHWDVGWKRRVPCGKCAPTQAGSAWLKTCTLSLPVAREGEEECQHGRFIYQSVWQQTALLCDSRAFISKQWSEMAGLILEVIITIGPAFFHVVPTLPKVV